MTAETAWRLFIERGYDNVTVADICAAADIAPRTFHRYFAGKEDVVAEPLRRMAKLVEGHIAEAPAEKSDVEVLRGALMALGRYAVEHRDLLRALRTVSQRSHVLRAASVAPPEQEQSVVALVAARHPGADPGGWELRLLVGCAVTAYRVWYDDYLGGRPSQPIAYLERILDRVLSALHTDERV
ncbi:TetR family transcriptional regulator [Actinoplanes sp. CA-131856]